MRLSALKDSIAKPYFQKSDNDRFTSAFGNVTQKEIKEHQQLKQDAAEYSAWQDLVDLGSNAVSAFVTPSGIGIPRKFTYDDAQHIVLDIALKYGEWQDKECQHMKASLLSIDSSRDGTVRLEKFHAFPGDAHDGYKFRETHDYLQKIGALEESASGGSRVIVSNYLAASTNCVASSAYVAVCCRSSCKTPVRTLDALVQEAWSSEALKSAGWNPTTLMEATAMFTKLEGKPLTPPPALAVVAETTHVLGSVVRREPRVAQLEVLSDGETDMKPAAAASITPPGAFVRAAMTADGSFMDFETSDTQSSGRQKTVGKLAHKLLKMPAEVHGTKMRQWLHEATPYECPLPVLAETGEDDADRVISEWDSRLPLYLV